MAEFESFGLTWRSGLARGFTDILPRQSLQMGTGDPRFVHLVRGPRGSLSAATCVLTLKGKVARLDYNPFPAENTPAGMDLGVMRIQFKDADRTEIALIQWADGTSRRFKTPDIKVGFEKKIAWRAYKPVKGKRKLVWRKAKERRGQAAFRARLMLVYGTRCCISGCTVAEALDGAHIDPYENPTFDSPQNGLLLRRDLHALFDANLVAIEPTSHRIIVAESLRESADYAIFHNKKLRAPVASFAATAPDVGAMERRFEAFEG